MPYSYPPNMRTPTGGPPKVINSAGVAPTHSYGLESAPVRHLHRYIRIFRIPSRKLRVTP